MTAQKKVKPKIAAALSKNQRATQNIEHSERELAVVHAVLDKKVPASQREGDIGQAVAKTNEVEKQLMESVALLKDVNNILMAELDVGKVPPSGRKAKP